MSKRLRAALQEAGGHLFAASLHMPTDWQRAKVREWADKAGRIGYAASVGRNPEGEDRNELRAQHEHAVPNASEADAHD